MEPLRLPADDAQAAVPASLPHRSSPVSRMRRSRSRLAINRALHDILDPLPGGDDLRRRRRPQRRGVRRHPRAAGRRPVRRGCSTRCSTSSRSSASRSARACRDCCRSPKSSTSPTFTTPRTRSAARRRHCSSSPTASTATRWWSASPATDTRRVSAGTFTTTTRSPRCATSPVSSIASPARPDDAAAMLHTCAAAAREAGVVCLFLEPIALYHTRDLLRRRRRRLARAVPGAGRADRPGANLR